MNKLQLFIHKLKDSENRYEPKKISPIKKAKAMDTVLELCMKYYVGKENEIDFFKIENVLNKKFDFHSYESEFIMRIMIGSNYIKAKWDEDKTLNKVYCDEVGFKLFLDGGFLPEAKRKRSTRRLIRIGQYSAAIGGFYYLTLLLKENLKTIQDLWSYLF